MRKSCKRVIRHTATLITPAQHDELLLGPRLHLQMLVDGHAELPYLYSVAGVFNIAVALSHLQSNGHAQAQFGTAQEMVFNLIREKRAPIPEESSLLVAAINAASALLRRQTTSNLTRAIAYVEQMIASGDALALAPNAANNL